MHRIKKIISYLSVTLFLIACGGEEENAVVATPPEQGQVWTDSIFGTISEKERYYQHLIIEVPDFYQDNLDSLGSWIVENQPGGLKFDNWSQDSIARLKKRLDTLDIIQPFIHANYFDQLELSHYPYWESNPKLESMDYISVFSKAGFNLVDFQTNYKWTPKYQSWLDSVRHKKQIFPLVRHYSDTKLKEDYDRFFDDMRYIDHILQLNLSVYDTIQLAEVRKSGGFKGLFLVDASTESVNPLLAGGADLLFYKLDAGDPYKSWNAEMSGEVFEESTKRILQLKSKMGTPTSVEQNFDSELKYVRSNLQQKSTALISNKGKLIPFKKRFSIYAEEKVKILPKVKRDLNISTYKKELNVAFVEKLISSADPKVICLNDTTDKEVLKVLSKLEQDKNTVVCFSNPEHFDKLKALPNLVFYPHSKHTDYTLLGQQMAGRISMEGDFYTTDSLYKGKKIQPSKLARTIPEFVGLDRDTLARIDWAVKQAMNGRAFPGCQVLIAKDNCIIYDKSFGHHSYERKKLVTEESMYDLASLTKVVATTMIGMKLYEMESYHLGDSLYMYQPDSLKDYLRYPSTIRNITFQELFIHKSGLPSGFPIIDYMLYTNEKVNRFDKYYCDIPDSVYKVEVAENFYMEKEYQDSMWLKLNSIWLDKTKPYNYSDVSMNSLYFFFKSIITTNRRKYDFTQSDDFYEDKDLFVEYLYNTYYKPLGMEHSRYKPLRHFSKDQIVPTEDESYWRKQLLQGHVHDPNAALHGGIAGNAGMFSTTNDLAILAQMLLNEGIYDGKRYLKSETVNKFSSRQDNSHRGLGWNKPTITSSGYGCADSASLATYGHTGFTGTCIWIDPRSELIYVFLSNRVHPKVNNRIYQYGIRKRIHQSAYDAMMNGSGTRN